LINLIDIIIHELKSIFNNSKFWIIVVF